MIVAADLNVIQDAWCVFEIFFINPNTAKAMHVHVWQLHS